MRKTIKKLSLSKETLRALDETRLDEAVGGTFQTRTCGSICHICIPRTEQQTCNCA